MNAEFKYTPDAEKPLNHDSGLTEAEYLSEFNQNLQYAKKADLQALGLKAIKAYGKPNFNEYIFIEAGSPPVNGVDVTNYLALPARKLGSSDAVNYCLIDAGQPPVWLFEDHYKPERGFISFNLPEHGKPDFVYVVHEIEAAFKVASCNLPCVLVPPVSQNLVQPVELTKSVRYAIKATVDALEAQGVQVYAPVPAHQASTFKTLLGDSKAQVLKLPDLIDQYQDEAGLTDALKQLRQKAENAKLQDMPEPKPIQSELLPVKPLKREMLPTDIAAYVFDEADRADNMPPDGVAACVLVSLSSLIGARVGVKPKRQDDWTLVPNLWGGIAAPPSSKKSPALDAALKPLNKIIVEAKKEYAEAMQEFTSMQMMAKADRKALNDKLNKAAKKGDDSEKQQIASELAALDSAELAQAVERRYQTNDGSIEAIIELEKTNPNGILVVRDELTGWLSIVDKEPTDRAFYLEAYNGNSSYQYDRIMRGAGYVENHCLSILGGIQPDKLVTYLEPSIKGLGNDGLMQRFQLLVYPDPTAWEYRDRAPDKVARNSVYELFAAIDKLTENDLVKIGAKPADDYNKRPYFRFSDEAQEVFKEWTTVLNEQKVEQEEHSIIAQHLQKYPKLMAGLALIFHIIDGVSYGRVGSISKDAALMAIEWCDYLESHARRIYGLVLDASTMKAATIGDKLRALKPEHDWRTKGFTAREVHRKNWKGLTTIEAVYDALDILIDAHWLEMEEIEATVRGGRPTKRYWINPKIYKLPS